MCKFVRADVIRASTCLSEVDFTVDNQLSEDCIFVGFVTRQKLRALENGDVSSQACRKFLQGVRSFYEAAVGYMKMMFFVMLGSSTLKNVKPTNSAI